MERSDTISPKKVRYSKQLGISIDVGVSPRGTIALERCARSYAWLQGRNEVETTDIHAVLNDLFRHRLVISEHAKLNGRSVDDIIELTKNQVPVPEEKGNDRETMMIRRAKRT